MYNMDKYVYDYHVIFLIPCLKFYLFAFIHVIYCFIFWFDSFSYKLLLPYQTLDDIIIFNMTSLTDLAFY